MELLKSIFKGDKSLWIIYFSLCIISIIEYYSASSVLAFAADNYWDPIKAHTKFLMMGTLILIVFHHIDYKMLKAFTPIIYIFAIGCLVYLSIRALLGLDLKNNAARWIEIKGISFQPSELAKLSIIFISAQLLSFQSQKGRPTERAMKIIFIIAMIPIALIATENLSMAVLCTALYLIMLYYANSPLKTIGKHLLYIIIAGGVFFGGRYVYKKITTENESGLHRAETWDSRINKHIGGFPSNPDSLDFENDGQVIFSRIAIAESKGIGKGFGNSTQRNYVTHAFSDFIFAIIIEEAGIIGAIIVILLYVWLIINARKLAKKCDDPYGILLLLGISTMITLQATANMLVAVGIMPVTGLPLPMISKGGTSIVVYSSAYAVLLSVSRSILEKEEERKMIEELNIRDNKENEDNTTSETDDKIDNIEPIYSTEEDDKTE